MIYAVRYENSGMTRLEEKHEQSRIARQLLSAALLSEYDFREQLPPMLRAEHGKPRFACGCWEFNLAHTTRLAVAALSKRPVGIDCEAVKPYRETLARRICTENELAELTSCNDRNMALTRLWTLKEAYLKYTGEGLTGVMRECGFSLFGERPRLKDSRLLFSQYVIFEDYVVSVCSEEELGEKINILDLSQL